jgi:zinc/manganese transport system substrate-binding protein
MSKILFRLLSLSLIGAAVAVSQPAHAAKVRVVATLTDMADFAREIGGEHVDVSSLATGVEDTHGVPMKPSFVPMLNRADLLINAGFGLEHAFLPALLEASKNPKIQYGHPGYVDCSIGVIPVGVPKSTDHSEGDVHPGEDSHRTHLRCARDDGSQGRSGLQTKPRRVLGQAGC